LTTATTYLAKLFLPALLAGLGCAIAWRFVAPGRLRTNLQIAGSVLFFVPQPPVLLFLYQSMALLIYQEALFALWMLGIAALCLWHLTQRKERGQLRGVWKRRASSPQRRPIVLAIIGLAMGGFGLSFAWQFVADEFLPRIMVQGHVQALTRNYGSRTPRLWDIMIDGRTYKATHDIARLVTLGERIRAEVGAGSHAVLKIEGFGEGRT
jgi:hypothetical protein